MAGFFVVINYFIIIMETYRNMYAEGLANLGVDAGSIKRNLNRFEGVAQTFLEKRDCPRKETRLNNMRSLCVTVFDASEEIRNKIDSKYEKIEQL
jgi:hypothetical protein